MHQCIDAATSCLHSSLEWQMGCKSRKRIHFATNICHLLFCTKIWFTALKFATFTPSCISNRTEHPGCHVLVNTFSTPNTALLMMTCLSAAVYGVRAHLRVSEKEKNIFEWRLPSGGCAVPDTSSWSLKCVKPAAGEACTCTSSRLSCTIRHWVY